MTPEFLLGLVLAADTSKALIEWTPVTYYVTAGIFHSAATYVVYRLLNAEPEHNTIVGALLAGAGGNTVAYFVRDLGLAGILGTCAAFLALLAAISMLDFFRSIAVFVVLMALYAGLNRIVIPRTPLTAQKIGGVPRVFHQGGLEPEPMDRRDETDGLRPESDST